MDSATNLHRKAFDSCKLSLYIWLLGLAHRLHQGSARGPRWGTSTPRSPVRTVTSEPGYTTALVMEADTYIHTYIHTIIVKNLE